MFFQLPLKLFHLVLPALVEMQYRFLICTPKVGQTLGGVYQLGLPFFLYERISFKLNVMNRV